MGLLVREERPAPVMKDGSRGWGLPGVLGLNGGWVGGRRSGVVRGSWCGVARRSIDKIDGPSSADKGITLARRAEVVVWGGAVVSLVVSSWAPTWDC